MWTDPIVNEIRKHSEEYAASLNHDLKAICEDLKRRQQESIKAGRKVVTVEEMRKRNDTKEVNI